MDREKNQCILNILHTWPKWLHSVGTEVGRGGSIGWLVGWFYGVSTFFESFNTELSHFDISFKQFKWV